MVNSTKESLASVRLAQACPNYITINVHKCTHIYNDSVRCVDEGQESMQQVGTMKRMLYIFKDIRSYIC